MSTTEESELNCAIEAFLVKAQKLLKKDVTQKGMLAWIKHWKYERRESKLIATFSKIMPQLQSEDRKYQAKLSRLMDEKEQIQPKVRSLLKLLELSLQLHQTRLSCWDDVINDAREVDYDVNISISELKASLNFNQDILRQSGRQNKLKSSSELPPRTDRSMFSDTISLEGEVPDPFVDDTFDQPAKWQGYQGSAGKKLDIKLMHYLPPQHGPTSPPSSSLSTNKELHSVAPESPTSSMLEPRDAIRIPGIGNIRIGRDIRKVLLERIVDEDRPKSCRDGSGTSNSASSMSPCDDEYCLHSLDDTNAVNLLETDRDHKSMITLLQKYQALHVSINECMQRIFQKQCADKSKFRFAENTIDTLKSLLGLHHNVASCLEEAAINIAVGENGSIKGYMECSHKSGCKSSPSPSPYSILTSSNLEKNRYAGLRRSIVRTGSSSSSSGINAEFCSGTDKGSPPKPGWDSSTKTSGATARWIGSCETSREETTGNRATDSQDKSARRYSFMDIASSLIVSFKMSSSLKMKGRRETFSSFGQVRSPSDPCLASLDADDMTSKYSPSKSSSSSISFDRIVVSSSADRIRDSDCSLTSWSSEAQTNDTLR